MAEIRYVSKSGNHRGFSLFADISDELYKSRYQVYDNTNLTVQEEDDILSLMYGLDRLANECGIIADGIIKNIGTDKEKKELDETEGITDKQKQRRINSLNKKLTTYEFKTYRFVRDADGKIINREWVNFPCFNPDTSNTIIDEVLTKELLEDKLSILYLTYRDLFISILRNKNYAPTARTIEVSHIDENGNKVKKSDEALKKIESFKELNKDLLKKKEEKTENDRESTRRMPEALKLSLWFFTYMAYYINDLYSSRLESGDLKFPFRLTDRGMVDFINELGEPKHMSISKNTFQKFKVSPSRYFNYTNYKDIGLVNKYAGQKKGYLSYALRNLFMYQSKYGAVIDLFGGSGRASLVFPFEKNVEYFINEWNFFNINYYYVLKDVKLRTLMLDYLNEYRGRLEKARNFDSRLKNIVSSLDEYIYTPLMNYDNVFNLDFELPIFTRIQWLSKIYRNRAVHLIKLRDVLSYNDIEIIEEIARIKKVLVFLKDFYISKTEGYRYYNTGIEIMIPKIERLVNFSVVSVETYSEFLTLANELEKMLHAYEGLENISRSTGYRLRDTIFMYRVDKKDDLDSDDEDDINEKAGLYPISNFVLEGDKIWTEMYNLMLEFEKKYNDVGDENSKGAELDIFDSNQNKLVRNGFNLYRQETDEYKAKMAAAFVYLWSFPIMGVQISPFGVTNSTLERFLNFQSKNGGFKNTKKNQPVNYFYNHALAGDILIRNDVQIFNSDALFDDEFLIQNFEYFVEKRKKEKGAFTKTKRSKTNIMRTLIYSDSPYLGTVGYGVRDKAYVKENNANGNISETAMEHLVEKLSDATVNGHDVIFSCRVNPKPPIKRIPDEIDLSDRDSAGNLNPSAFLSYMSSKKNNLNLIKDSLKTVDTLYNSLFIKFRDCMKGRKELYVLVCLQNPSRDISSYVKNYNEDIEYTAKNERENDDLIKFLLEDKFRRLLTMEMFITTFDFITPLDYDTYADSGKEYYIFKKYKYNDFIDMLNKYMFKTSQEVLDSLSIVPVEGTKNYKFVLKQDESPT